MGAWPGSQGAGSGDRVMAPTKEQEPRPAVGTTVSFGAALPTMIRFCGPSGSFRGPVFSRWSARSRACRPRPPT
jgi:hypothetical protein